MASLTPRDYELVRTGLQSDPKCVPENLHWVTQEGYEVFKKRHRSSHFFHDGEYAVIQKAAKELASMMPEKVVVVDLGAGVCRKPLAVFRALLEQSSERQLCYIPVDRDDCIHGWDNYIEEAMPEHKKRFHKSIPVVGDMVESIQNMKSILDDNGVGDWAVVYTMFGPTMTIFPPEYVITIHDVIAKEINRLGAKGHFFYTYKRWCEDTIEVMDKEYYSKYDKGAMMGAILLGLNRATDADLDLSKMEYEAGYVKDFDVPERGDTTIAGWYLKGVAKEPLSFTCKKLDNLHVRLEKGETIRCSVGSARDNFYPDDYLVKLAANRQLQTSFISVHDHGAIGCICFSQ